MDGVIGFKGKKVFACSAEIIITELTTKNRTTMNITHYA